tara:strand:+ start:1761 stop:2558 length:798 start_codon:yes stop_codon:yes gene_type:complete
MANRLQNKTALVTGAGAGIGRASALRFSLEGAKVIINDINADLANQTLALIAGMGGEAEVIVADVTQQQEVERLVEQSRQALGCLDILFCNAGGSLPAAFVDVSDDEFEAIYSLNFRSVHYCIKAALPIMLSQHSGAILCTSSGAGINYSPGLAAYGAAKAGLTSLARSIAVEYGSQGIRANVIAPGPIETASLRAWLDSLDAKQTETNTKSTYQEWCEHVPVGRLGAAEDIANAALFLVSDEAAFVNGVLLPVDGAIHAKLSSA